MYPYSRSGKIFDPNKHVTIEYIYRWANCGDNPASYFTK